MKLPVWQKQKALPFLLAVGAVILDQITKSLALTYLKPIDTLPLWDGVFHFTYTTNPGAAFSLFADQRWVFLSISTVAIIAIVAYVLWMKDLSPLMLTSLGMILGGGIGNMIDRLALGEVIDFLDFRLIRFPIFNVADCFVTVGAGLLFLALVLDWVREEREKKQGQTAKEGRFDTSDNR